jgi:hypothetical protein
MQPLNIKLYDLARAKLHLKDSDAMEFVSTIHELQESLKENLVTKEFLSKELSDTKFDILKWIFIFWVGQLSITIGIVLMLIKK